MLAIISSDSWVRALILAAAVLGTPNHAAANALQHDRFDLTAAVADRTPEPFGLLTSTLPEGPLPAKWREVERSIAAEAETIADCRTSPDTCVSQPAVQFLKIVKTAASRSGLARLGEINRAFNLTIRPVSDLAQYGVVDRWTSPLATLAAGAGDCEDYAIAKLVALREAGVAQKDLRLIIVRETAIGDDHAVAAARVDGRWHILDNRTMVMVEDSKLSKSRPLFAMDAGVIKRFEHQQVAASGPPSTEGTAQPTATTPSGTKADVIASVVAPEIAPDFTGDLWSTQVM